jgi:hypothetical protein
LLHLPAAETDYPGYLFSASYDMIIFFPLILVIDTGDRYQNEGITGEGNPE